MTDLLSGHLNLLYVEIDSAWFSCCFSQLNVKPRGLHFSANILWQSCYTEWTMKWRTWINPLLWEEAGNWTLNNHYADNQITSPKNFSIRSTIKKLLATEYFCWGLCVWCVPSSDSSHSDQSTSQRDGKRNNKTTNFH